MKVALLTLIAALSAFSISLTASADPECVYRQIRDLPMHWSNPTDCARYYRCSNKNVKKEVVCSGKKEYNPKTGKCASAGKGYCKLSLAAPVVGDDNVCANEVSGAFVPQPNSCRNYYICNDKVAYPQSCDAGSIFNLTTSACVPDTTTECWQNYCLKIADGIYLPDQSSCLSFYICDNTNAVQQSCGSGSYFNANASNCQPDVNNANCWENFCLEQPDGSVLKNLNDCHAYYTCQSGKTTAQQCIEGSYFDWQTLQCKVGECPSDETTPSEPCEPTPTPPSCGGEGSNEECTCPGGYVEGTMLPDPTSCMHYLVCTSGILVRRECGDGFYFNGTTSTCQMDTENQCPQCNANYRRGKRSVDGSLEDAEDETDVKEIKEAEHSEELTREAINEPTCAGLYREGELVPDDNDCNKYQICEDGDLITQACGSGYYYDIQEQVCLIDVDFKCNPRPEPVVEVQPDPVVETAVVPFVESAVSSCTCPGGYQSGEILPHPTDCDKYYTCENGQLIIGECGQGYKFDSCSKECIRDEDHTCWPQDDGCGCSSAPPVYVCVNQPNGELVPGPNCSSYYTCNNQVAELSYCKFDSYFNPIKKVCEIDLNATCINPCAGTTTITLLPHPDCTKFYFCNNGETHVYSCPNGTGFNEQYEACTTDAKCPSSVCSNKDDGYSFADEYDKTKFYFCQSGLAISADCPINTEFNPTMMICMAAPSTNCNQTKCVAGTNVTPFETLDHSVNAFCYCRDDGAYINTCPSEYVFNPTLGICYSNAPCDPEVCYEQIQYTVTANRNDTNSFCLCVAEQQVIVNCPGSLEFNARAGSCMKPITQDPNCNPTYCLNAPDDTTTSALNNNNGFCLCRYGGSTFVPCLNQGIYNPHYQVCVPNTVEVQCALAECDQAQKIFPTLNDPYGFCFCYNDTTVQLHSCLDGMKFNNELLICEPVYCDSSVCTSTQPSNQPFPAIDFPQGFCLCNGTDATLHICDEGQIFDDTHLVCTDEANLLCDVTLCANAESYPFPLPAKGDEYSFCYCLSANHVVPLHCPGGTIFDQQLGFCANETNVPDNPGCGGNTDQCTCPGGYPAGEILPHPTVCNQYYICSNGKLVLGTCGAGLWFNPSQEACVQDENGVCLSDGGTACPTQVATCVGAFKENELIPHAYNRQLYYRCSNAQIREESCAPNFYFDMKDLACYSEYDSKHFYKPRTIMAAAPASDDFPCMNNEKRSVPSNCSQYEICVDSSWQRRSCSKQRYYNPEMQKCLEPRDDTVCQYARVQGLPACHNATAEQTLPHKDAVICGRYFRCMDGKWQLKSCRNHEYYSRSMRTCLSTQSSDLCAARNASENARIELESGKRVKCAHTAVRAYAPKCDMFLMCLEGEWWQQYCPLGMYFNTSVNYCLPSDGISSCSDSDGLSPKAVDEFAELSNLNCSSKDALRASATACERYYKCLNGRWQQMKCAVPGQFFNVTSEVCIADTLGVCSELSANCREDAKREFPLNCRAFELCEQGQWQRRDCGKDETFDTILKQCVANSQDYCAANGLRRTCQAGDSRAWPLSGNCTHFYYCEHDEWQTGACLQGHTYLTDLRTCVPHAANNSCKPNWHSSNILPNDLTDDDAGQIDETNVCALQADGNSVPHPYDCRRYYLCLHGQSIGEQHCSGDAFFDKEIGYCRPNDGTCQTPIRVHCDAANIDELIAHVTDCRSYYQCSSALEPQLKQCADGEYFDGVLKKCRIDRGECRAEPLARHKCANVSEHGTKLPHESYCNIYYACVRGLAIPVECPVGQEFNPVLGLCQMDEEQQCLNGELVHGNETTYSCGNLTDGTHLPNHNDCTKYYICTDGHAQPQRCGAKTYFDAQQLLCVADDDGACPYVDDDGEDGEDGDGEGAQEPPDPKICEGKHGNMLPDPSNCNEFYVCINGKLKHERCYENFYFNTITNQCQLNDLPTTTTTPAATTATTEASTFSTTITTLSTSSTQTPTSTASINGIAKSNIDVNTTLDLILELSASRAAATQQRCKDKPTNFTQLCKQIPEDGSIAQQGDCRYYISCPDGEPVSQRCRNGEIYDSLIGFCRQNDGTCLLENGQRVGECNGRHGELARDAANCRAYFICINGQKIPAECADGDYFSKSNNMCQADETGQCSQTPKKSKDDEVSCKGLSESVLYPYLPDHCRSYFQCVKGVPKVIECADGLYFNATTTNCVKEIKECQMRPIIPATTTQPNTHRAPEAQSLCTNATTGQPYANIEDHCQSYYVCGGADDDEKISFTKCPNGTLYSSERRACAAANHVTCN